jgi:hypothetical protein
MAQQATYDDANLILRLYELRREDKMRQARDWFAGKFHVNSMEDMQKVAPPGSPENAYVRMVTSYWEMVGSFVNSGVLNQELFFESGGEFLFVWERVRPIVPAFREMMKNPMAYHNLEKMANNYIQYMERTRGKESYDAFAAMVRSVGR